MGKEEFNKIIEEIEYNLAEIKNGVAKGDDTWLYIHFRNIHLAIPGLASSENFKIKEPKC